MTPMAVLFAVAAFVVMEPVTYALHRWVMHGLGWVLHRSHHRAHHQGWDANDWFPVMFAGLTITGLAVGTGVGGVGALVPVCVGVTVYGAAYAFVHDICIHGRLGLVRLRGPLGWLASAHDLHHRYGGEPYGMLLPIVPSSLRERAAAARAGAAEEVSAAA